MNILTNRKDSDNHRKKYKIYKIYIIFFSSDILQKGDANQMKPTVLEQRIFYKVCKDI